MVELIVSEVVSGFSFIFVVVSVGAVVFVVVEVVVCRFGMCAVLRVRVRSLLRSANRSFAVSYRVRVVVVLRSPDVGE